MKARLLVGASFHTPFSSCTSRRESTYGETPYLWGKAHNAREHKNVLAGMEQSRPASPMANGSVNHLNGSVYHFPFWPCPPCRPTIARRAFNCRPCNRSKAWSKKPWRSACRLALDPGDPAMMLPALVSSRVAFGRVARPAAELALGQLFDPRSILALSFRYTVAHSPSVYGHTPHICGARPR